MIHEGNLSSDRETDILTGFGIPRHRSTLVTEITYHERKAIVLNANRHLYRFRGLSFQFYHNRYHCIRSLAHCIIIKVSIVLCSCYSVLDIADSGDKDGRVLHHHLTIFAHGMQAIMTCCHVLSITILFQQNIHTLAHKYSRRDTVLLGFLPLVLSIETINDIAHIIYRDDALVLRETYVISLCLLTQVIESRKTLQIIDVTSEVDIILNVDTITLWSHDRAILLRESKTAQPAVSSHTILRMHFPCAYTIQHLDIAISS